MSTGSTPHDNARLCRLRMFGDMPTSRVDGRKRAIDRPSRPVRVQQMIAAAPTSSAACHAAWVIESVIRSLTARSTSSASRGGSARSGRPTAGSRPRARPVRRSGPSFAPRATGSCPIAVSAESITASVPSNTALATSLTSARVGDGASIIDSSIWVAVITGRADRDAVADDLLLEVGHVLERAVDAEVAAGDHDGVGALGDLGQLAERRARSRSWRRCGRGRRPRRATARCRRRCGRTRAAR